MEEQIKALIESMKRNIEDTEAHLTLAKEEVAIIAEELKSKKIKLKKAEALLEGEN